MLRELDFVEGDWGALLWAFGSVTALLRHSVLHRLKAQLEKRFGTAQGGMLKNSERILEIGCSKAVRVIEIPNGVISMGVEPNHP